MPTSFPHSANKILEPSQPTGSSPPRAVRTFILGQSEPIELDGRMIKITPKFFGDDALVESSIITLAGNRGLMLVGEPGTAKTMLSELLSAAICGISTNTVQGTAGTSEDNIKYFWNYVLLLAKGPVTPPPPRNHPPDLPHGSGWGEVVLRVKEADVLFLKE